jgi:hypothetical protein
MIVQLTARPVELHGFQGFNAAFGILFHIARQGGRAHIRHPADILVLHPLAFQPQHFHLLLDEGVRMIVPLVIERSLVAFVERYSNHGDPLSSERITTLNRYPY